MLLIKCLGLEAKVLNWDLDIHNYVFVLDEPFNVVEGKRQCFTLGQSMSMARSSFALYKFIHIQFLLLLLV